jgi:pimeloyl-ACP methyl ester carboxylesterase
LTIRSVRTVIGPSGGDHANRATRAGRLAFDELGAGPGLLLLPAAHERHDWDGVRPALADRFRTIALDWPGHGDSPMPPPPVGPAAAPRRPSPRRTPHRSEQEG